MSHRLSHILLGMMTNATIHEAWTITADIQEYACKGPSYTYMQVATHHSDLTAHIDAMSLQDNC